MRESCLTVEAVMRVFATQGDAPQGSLGGRVIDLDEAVVDIAGERVP